MASKKGVEIEKKKEPEPQQRASETKRNTFANSNQKFKSSIDPWERDNLNELEDANNKSKHSGGAVSTNVQDKKRALFGLNGGGTGLA